MADLDIPALVAAAGAALHDEGDPAVVSFVTKRYLAQGIRDLVIEIGLLREQLDNVNASLAYALRNENKVVDADDLDLELLHKLAAGEGGRRTGALRRAGYVEFTVTSAGLRALAASGAVTGCGCEICRSRGKDG